MTLTDIRHAKWFETAYKIGVGIKGFDGVVELITGILLIFSPHTPHRLLQRVAVEAGERHGSLFRIIEHAVIKLDADLGGQTLFFVILFLIAHGVIKLVLVYCLFREYYHAYPYALALLVVLLFVQIMPLFKDPTSLGLWFFTVLDVLIIYLVWGEYQDLREKIIASKLAKKA